MGCVNNKNINDMKNKQESAIDIDIQEKYTNNLKSSRSYTEKVTISNESMATKMTYPYSPSTKSTGEDRLSKKSHQSRQLQKSGYYQIQLFKENYGPASKSLHEKKTNALSVDAIFLGIPKNTALQNKAHQQHILNDTKNIKTLKDFVSDDLNLRQTFVSQKNDCHSQNLKQKRYIVDLSVISEELTQNKGSIILQSRIRQVQPKVVFGPKITKNSLILVQNNSIGIIPITP